MVEDMDEQPDEEERSRRVLSAGASVSVELGYVTLPHMWMCLPTWKFSKPLILWGFL